MSELQIVLAGFGGQGVLFAGKVVSYAALIEDRELSWLPSYGPEMRGGTANCSVTISDDPIGSPLVTTPDVLVAMNQPSFDKFLDEVREGGVIIADTDMVPNLRQREGVRVVGIPSTTLAEDAGLKGLSNIVLVGKLWAETHFCARETLDAAMGKCVPAKKAAMLEKNKQALEIGIGA
ncbi:MAG: 2-oxoacid:acceptor oxidoreductase family protein [Eggerthellaceae bacterium]|nr:2-oxoacid:acceptor oxidoreductase family protein [Eggerthellaceae bacterium]